MNLRNYLRAGYPAVAVVTPEESRAQGAIIASAAQVSASGDHRVYSWSPTMGVWDMTSHGEVDPKVTDPIAAIKYFTTKIPERAIFVMYDFQLFLSSSNPNPILVRTIREACAVLKQHQKCLVFLGCRISLPPELEKDIAIDEFKLPTAEELGAVLDEVCTETCGIPVITGDQRYLVLSAAAGLTTIEMENVCCLSFAGSKTIDPAVIAAEKAKIIKKSGILEIVHTDLNADSIGGLEHLKAWIGRRRNAMTIKAREFGVPTPKGVLVVGIPGTGKSLVAKASAAMLGCPLIRLDGGRIFGGIIGQSEANMRKVIETAEACAPCVLHIDEVNCFSLLAA